MASRPALVLLAHGSPDPQWRLPFDDLRRRAQVIDPARTIVVAFLNHCQPSLTEAVRELATAGERHVLIASVFLSAGGNHVRRDIPAMINQLERDFPSIQFDLIPGAVGAAPEVIEAIARTAVQLASDR